MHTEVEKQREYRNQIFNAFNAVLAELRFVLANLDSRDPNLLDDETRNQVNAIDASLQAQLEQMQKDESFVPFAAEASIANARKYIAILNFGATADSVSSTDKKN